MTENNPIRPYEINLRVLFFQLLSHWRSILIGTLAIAAAFTVIVTARSAAAGTPSPEAQSSQVEALQLWVHDLHESIESLQTESGLLIDRLRYAPRYQIDPAQEAVSEVEFILRQEDTKQAHPLDALIGAYSFALREGEYIGDLAGELSILKKEYVSELISLETLPLSGTERSLSFDEEQLRLDVSMTVNAASQESAVILLKVIAPDIAMAERIAQAAEEELRALTPALSRQVLAHSVELLSRRSYITEDKELAAEKNDTYNYYYGLNLTKEIRDEALAAANAALAAAEAPPVNATSPRAIVKRCILGLLLGGFLMVAGWCVRLLLGRRFVSVDQFYSRYSLNRLGALPLAGQRSLGAFDRWVLSRIGDYSGEDEERSLALTAANIAAFAEREKRLFITGQASPEKLRAVGERLRALLPQYELCAAPDFQNDVAAFAELSEADGVVLCEERCVSRFDRINSELTTLSSMGKTIIGSVIL